MLVVISPAKKLNEKSDGSHFETTQVQLPDKCLAVMSNLQKLKPVQIAKLMKLSPALSELNYQRYQNFNEPSVTKAAMFLFDGDTYTGLDASSMSEQVVTHAQKQIRILSGLYGVLRPLDKIAPYRLEMGTSLKVDSAKNLYQWWGQDVTELINKDLVHFDYLANLASNEYFKVIDSKSLTKPIINFKFLDKKGDQYKLISFNAKRARGTMARIIVEQQIRRPSDLTQVQFDGYRFNKSLSSELNFTYTRD